MTNPLKDILVLDMSRVLAGPWATQILADLGARVIKVEKPGTGDETRAWGPPYLEGEEGASESAYYLSANRGKESLALDITTDEGQAVIRSLAKRADVLVENFRVGGLKKYGLDYDSLKAVNPGLVYCSITGFGQSGPRAGEPGYDFLIQGMAGLMSITGTEDSGPMKAGVAISDITTGLYAVIAILSALHARGADGKGRYIDMALFDTQLGWLANQGMNYLISGTPPTRRGNAHPNIVPYQDFPTADGRLIITVGNDGQFARMAAALGHPEWADDARFASNRARVENRETLIPLMEKALKAEKTDTWLKRLAKARVPAGPVQNVAEALSDAQAAHRGMQFSLPHELTDALPQIRTPIIMDGEAAGADRAPPLLGEDTEALLKELGYSQSDIAAMRGKGVIG